ncbi:MAG: PRC-barrel domain-containing protein [Rhodospirillales bacterium]
MRKSILLVTAAIIGTGMLTADANALGAVQPVEISKIDIHTVSAGYRASKSIGSKVLNDTGEKIGTINDLLVTRGGKEPYVVLSVGEFLGLGDRLVVVHYDSIRFAADNKIVFPGDSMEGLKMLPASAYAKE